MQISLTHLSVADILSLKMFVQKQDKIGTIARTTMFYKKFH